jgi:hypothetical protein
MKLLFITKFFVLMSCGTLLLFSSCREDIIPPGNEGGNINQPVRLKEGNSYTFILNADNISTTVMDYSGLNSIHTVLLLSVDKYKQGQATFNIYEYSDRLVYQKLMTSDVKQIAARLDDVSPDIIKINFIGFTGILKIQVVTN